VYFLMPRAPHGSMAERTIVPATQCLLLPDDLDDVTAAAIANPGMSSWAAYTERARLQPGETVLINGATGTAGRLAVQIAKYLGAGKVVVTGRNKDALQVAASLGADVAIPLVADETALRRNLREQFAEGVDVVIDYLWGQSAECILMAAAVTSVPIRFVQVGSLSAPKISLASSALRSTPITVMGSGIGSVPPRRFVNCIAGLLQATVPGNFKISAKRVPIEDVETAWPEDDSSKRTVFTMHASVPPKVT
jgi:NADPH:quinone reductase-like Zn-dependent oxidoreductase